MLSSFTLNAIGISLCTGILAFVFLWIYGYKIKINIKKILLIVLIHLIGLFIIRKYFAYLDNYVVLFPSMILGVMLLFEEYDFTTMMLSICAILYLFQNLFYFRWIVEFILFNLEIKYSDEIISFVSILIIFALTYSFSKMYMKINIDLEYELPKYKNWKKMIVIESIIVSINLIILQVGLNILNDGMSKFSSFNFIFLILLTIIFNIVGLVFYGFIRVNSVSRQYSFLMEKYMKQQTNHYERLAQLNYKTRLFRHDINNHLDILSILINEKQYKEAQNYLADLIERNKHLKMKYKTGNAIIDAIINDYAEKYQKCDIEIKIEGNLPKNLNISNVDVCVIWGNLIANAFEACARYYDKKYIELKFEIYKTFLNFTMENSSEKIVDFNTRKNNKENHGLGLINVEDCIRQYNGELEMRYIEHKVKTSLVIEI